MGPHGGFVFSFRIHEKENRWHFRHTLRARKFRVPSTALLVIASAKDLAVPAAWVRCLVVSSLDLNLPNKRRRHIGVASSDPLDDNESSAYSARHEDVPDHAIWLITTNPQHAVPTTDWHKSPESLEPSSSPPSPHQHQIYDDYINENSRKRAGIIFGLVFSPIVLVLFLGLVPLAVHTFGHIPVPVAHLIVGFAWFVVVWFFVWFFVLEYYVLTLCTLGLKGWNWRRREEQPRNDWKGGTSQGLHLGRLLSNGPIPTPNDWKRFWQTCQPALRTDGTDNPTAAPPTITGHN